MRKLIAALVLGVMACSSANAWQTYRYIDEDGIEREVSHREQYEIEGRAGSGNSNSQVNKRKDIRVYRNGNFTTIKNLDTNETVVCTQNPYDKSYNCH